MTAYATHQATLVESLLATTGPVLELGSGWFSTPILHAICEQQGRELWTLDNNASWLANFAELRRSWHRIELVSDWDSVDFGEREFGLVFVDHAPAERRVIEVRRLIEAGLAETFVIHDTESAEYGWDAIWPLFDDIDTRKIQRPWTSVCRVRSSPVNLPRTGAVSARPTSERRSMMPENNTDGTAGTAGAAGLGGLISQSGLSVDTLFEMLRATKERAERDAEWQASIEDAINDAVATGKFVICVASFAPDEADPSRQRLRVFQTSREFPHSQIGPFVRDLLAGMLSGATKQ